MSNPDPLAQGPERNLVDKRYKTCGYGNPFYNQDGHYDEVACGFFNNQLKWCGEIICPLDAQDPPDRDETEDDLDDSDEDDDYHGEDQGYA
jgi:hypothetical protein